MSVHPATLRSGHDYLTHPLGLLALLGTAAALVLLATRLGGGVAVKLSAALYGVPLLLIVLRRPVVSLYLLLALGFTANGLSRYIDAPWGLMADGTLALGWIATLVRRYPRNWDTPGDPRRWPELTQDGFLLAVVWFAFLALEIANPQAQSREAWFYAMRSVGLYPILAVGLAYFHLRERRQVRRVLHIVLAFSVLGALWGIRQKYFWLDAAEEHWLYVEDHARQHMLFGVLRTFSFYSDAGQFGASQAMASLMAGILALRAPDARWRVAYAIAAALCFVGFGISGTRGALAVPVGGGLLYLIVSRNVRVLVLGLAVMSGAYLGLRYTSVGSGIQQVQRMRTALDPNEASLQVRLRNQETLGGQLAGKPFGAGVGSAGYWGNRFSPNTIFAQTPTDSYFVRLWVEVGVVGLGLHLLILGYTLGCGTYRVWRTRDPVFRHERAALLCGYAGTLLASYGNQVFSQFPTALIVSIAIPVLLSERWDTGAGPPA